MPHITDLEYSYGSRPLNRAGLTLSQFVGLVNTILISGFVKDIKDQPDSLDIRSDQTRSVRHRRDTTHQLYILF